MLEPATGSVLTRVGNANAGDVARAAAEARSLQLAWAATPYERRAAILRRAAALLEENQQEIVYWIMRETGGIGPKAGFEVHMVANILHRSAAMVTEPQGLMLPTDPGRISNSAARTSSSCSMTPISTAPRPRSLSAPGSTRGRSA